MSRKDFKYLSIILISVGALLLLSLMSPFWTVILVILCGLPLVEIGFPELPLTVKLSISPAAGISFLTILFHLFSLVHLGIQRATLVFLITTVFLTISMLTQSADNILREINQEKTQILRWMIPIIVVVLIHWVAYTYPTDNVDNFFHATKIWYMLKYDTVYPKVVPVFDILTYPAGYHSLASFIAILNKKEIIPKIMLNLRLWEWVFFTMGVYVFSYSWFGRKVANYVLLTFIGVNIVHYYLLVYIAPNFLGFYFFTVLLALAKDIIEDPLADKKRFLIFILISVGSIFVHPYSYQNYVLIAGVYTLMISLTRTKPLIKILGELIKVGTLIFVVPVLIHAVLNPYFWFPSLAHVRIEYPWASYYGITISKLSVFHGKGPRDTWGYFDIFMKWATVRNDNYFGLLLTLLGMVYLTYKKESRAKATSLLFFTIFVMFLIIDRLTINVSVPFYSTAAIERMFLWLVPVIPVFTGAGVVALKEALSDIRIRKLSKTIFYLSMLLAFFMIPVVGTANDILSAEANFYVRPDNIEDFRWISENFPNTTILNSCTFDSAQWMPFFIPGAHVNVMFNSRIKRCRIYNVTPLQFARKILSENATLPGYLAYIDTNAPSLNPLDFFSHYKLLRINGNNWIYDLSSLDTSLNEDIAKKELKLCSASLPGNTEKFGQYFVYGFGKKYFGVRSLYMEGVEYAWLQEKLGIIAFSPCKDYIGILIDVYSPKNVTINITINNRVTMRNIHIAGCEKRVLVPIKIHEGDLTMVLISTNETPVFIRGVDFIDDLSRWQNDAYD